MELKANLLKLASEWIIAQVEPVEGDTLPGDPDVWMVEPYVVDCEGQITPWHHMLLSVSLMSGLQI